MPVAELALAPGDRGYENTALLKALFSYLVPVRWLVMALEL